MAKLVVGSFSFDMTTWNLADVAGGIVTSDTAGEVDVTGAGGHLVYKITGSGFTTFDTNGFPTDGTVTGVTMAVPGKVPMAISGISISATDFMGFVNGNDPVGLETAIFSGNDVFGGKAGNDTLFGYGGNDAFNLTKGGNDTVNGGDGNDTFTFGGAFTAGDSVDGGTGSDKVALDGDYSAGVTFGAATMVNVEAVTLVGAHSYNLVFNASSDTAGQSLGVTAAKVTGSAHNVTLDGSALAGTLRLVGTAGDDTLKGGSGTSTLNGGGGDDTIFAGTGDNHINGGDGNNTLIFTNWTAGESVGNGALVFNGDFSAGVTLSGSEFTGNVGSLQLTAGHDYNITLGTGAPIADVFASTLGAGDQLVLDDESSHGLLQVTAGAGNDVITMGATAAGNLNMTEGGNDTVTGNVFADTFIFGTTLTNADTINGGGGADVLGLSGDYSLTIGATTIQAIHEMQVAGGNGVTAVTDSFVENDANVAAGQTMEVDFSSTHDIDTDSFDGSAETDGSFIFSIAASPLSTMTGGAGNDKFVVSFGAHDSAFNNGDKFDGGAGNDSIEFVSGLSTNFKLGTHMLTSIETIIVEDGAVVTTADGNVGAGDTLNVVLQDGKFNGSKETDGSFNITGDTLSAIAGGGNDTISLTSSFGSGVTIHFTGGGGADLMSFDSREGAHALYTYNAVSDSTSAQYDTITDYNSFRDHFQLTFGVTGVDAAVSTGALSTATFDTDLAAAIGSSQLAANHAVLFTPDSGTLAGESFMIVDANGVAGYQAGQDLVVRLEGSFSLTTSDFVT